MDIDPSILANGKVAVGAAAGGMVRMFLRPARSLIQAMMLMASAITCGFYGTTPLRDFFDLPISYDGAIGAVLGVFGLSIVEGLLKSIERFDFSTILANFAGKPK